MGETYGADAADLRRRGILALVARLRSALLLVLAVVQLQTPRAYRLLTGSVAFELQPAWPDGRLVTPLGPAGSFSGAAATAARSGRSTSPGARTVAAGGDDHQLLAGPAHAGGVRAGRAAAGAPAGAAAPLGALV